MKINALLLAAWLVLLTLSGCKKEENVAAGPASETAVLMTLLKQSPDGNTYYMGTYPDVPTTEPDITRMIELGPDASTLTNEGYVYSFQGDARTISRWEVAGDLQMNKIATLSFANTGISGYTPVAFFSATRAFLFDLVNGKIVEWNPAEMTLTQTINVPVAPFTYSFSDKPRVFGNRILLSVSNVNYIGVGTLENQTTVALFDVAGKTLQYKTDPRGVTTFGNFMDGQGYVYFAPIREQHYSILYDPSNAGVTNFGNLTRFNMNTGEFDTNYLVKLSELVGGKVSQVMLLNDNELLVETIQEPFPSYMTQDNYFGAVRAKLKKVNLTTRAVTEYTSVGENDLTWTNNIDFKINDAFYFLPAQFPNKGPEYYKSINTVVYKVTATEAVKLFTATNTVIHTISKIR